MFGGASAALAGVLAGARCVEKGRREESGQTGGLVAWDATLRQQTGNHSDLLLLLLCYDL